ncbi:MAG TPA: hypothetical protein PLO67_21120 [Saprospiraceae bacterium]|nr:hypothetical protein [Saprospiraceae bacterium]
MNSLSERKQQIVGFWEIEEDAQRDQLVAEISAYANTQDPDAFSKEVRSQFEQINFSGISVIYEALTADPDKWAPFFKEEYKRAFKTAETAENGWDILECLEEIGGAKTYPEKVSDDMVSFLAQHLSSNNDVLRYKAVWLLGDWIGPENVIRHTRVVANLEEKLKDPNWKIRYIIKGFLEDLGKLPPGYQTGFIDKIRAKISSPYKL